MAPPKSDLWKYFTKTNKNEAKCNYCSRLVKTCGNTSNLKAHLKVHKLKDEIKSVSSASKASSTSTGTKSKLSKFVKFGTGEASTSTSSSADFQVSGSSSLSSVSPAFPMDSTSTNDPDDPQPVPQTSGASHRQRSILHAFGDIKQYSDGGARSSSITQGLVYFIAKDCMPFSLVDGVGFKRFMKETVPLYKVPTRNTIKSLIMKKYDVLSTDFRNTMDRVEYVSVTADVWSNMMTTTSYLGVTCHFLDGVSIQSPVLGVYELNQSHTGEYLGSQMLLALTEWNIQMNKVVCVATDNEAAMVKAVVDTFGKNKHVRCAAHSINLLAETAIKNTEGLDDLVKKVREIVKYVKRSVNASDTLRDEQLMRGIQEGEILKMILDVKTRWNSTYYMLERFLVLSTVVSSVLVSKPESPPMLTALELESVKEIKTLLSNLERLTREFSGENYITASMVIPLLNCFQKSIVASTPRLNVGLQLKQTLLTEFDARFKDREHAHLMSLPMFLDPRFKNIHFLDATASAKALTQIKKLVTALDKDKISDIDPEENLQESANEDATDLWSFHKSLAMQSTKKMAKPLESYVNLDSEIALYLSTPVAANHRANPLELWEDLKHVYPKLYVLARQYLVVVATSVPSERLFSKAGNTVRKKKPIEREVSFKTVIPQRPAR